MAESSRRGFLRFLNVAIGGVIGAVFAVPALRYVIFPTRRKVVEGPADPVPVARASKVGKTPLRVEIVVPEQRDAWAKVTDVRLGAAWLVRDAKDQIRAFSATCPHLGCAVDYDAEKGQFKCPCHTSAFDTEGNRLAGPAKRGMDPLDAQVDEKGRVLVRFQRFRQDSPGREPA